jgi:transposase
VAPLIQQADPSAGTAARRWLAVLLYQAATGEPWATLLQAEPHWASAYAAAQRWQTLGLLDQLSAAVLVRLSVA